MLSGFRRRLGGESGQIAIPSLFVIPSLFLFVFLIFETAKISREKIRHQFAVDSAAFIEMTNYSDFLNRSAYVNGAFPERIFHEGFYNTPIEKKNGTQGNIPGGDSLFTILYKNGVFPARSQNPGQTLDPLDDNPQWFIPFGGPSVGRNSNPPDMGNGLIYTTTLQNALDYWLSWDDAQDIYKLYVQIYQLLGSVEDAQYSVFCRLTGASGCGTTSNPHTFFRKSYWLNTNDDINDANDGMQGFSKSFRPKPYCIQQVLLVGNKPTNNPFQPYQQYQPTNPIPMPKTIENCEPSDGLFQMVAIPDEDLAKMNSPTGTSQFGFNLRGYEITQHWGQGVLQSNYFNVNFMNEVRCPSGGGPCVHATVSLSGGKLWPLPTPKFQTRLYP